MAEKIIHTIASSTPDTRDKELDDLNRDASDSRTGIAEASGDIPRQPLRRFKRVSLARLLGETDPTIKRDAQIVGQAILSRSGVQQPRV